MKSKTTFKYPGYRVFRSSFTSQCQLRAEGAQGQPEPRDHAADFRQLPPICLEKWHARKERIVRELHGQFGNSLDVESIRRAVQEADAVATMSELPSLFLPALAEEKVQAASTWQGRQQEIYARSLHLSA